MNFNEYDVYRNVITRRSGFNPVNAERNYTQLVFRFKEGDDWENCAIVTASFFQSADRIVRSTATLSENLTATVNIPAELLNTNCKRVFVGLQGSYEGENSETVTISTNQIAVNIINGVIVEERTSQTLYEELLSVLNTALTNLSATDAALESEIGGLAPANSIYTKETTDKLLEERLLKPNASAAFDETFNVLAWTTSGTLSSAFIPVDKRADVKQLYVAKRVRTIGTNAFTDCTNLRYVYVDGKGTDPLRTIDDNAFPQGISFNYIEWTGHNDIVTHIIKALANAKANDDLFSAAISTLQANDTLQDAAIAGKINYVTIPGSDSSSVDNCTDPNTVYSVYLQTPYVSYAHATILPVLSNNKLIQYALTRGGKILYRSKYTATGSEWTDWDGLEIIMDERLTDYGENPVPSKLIYNALQLLENAVYNSIIQGCKGDPSEARGTVHNNEVDEYINSAPYVADDYTYSNLPATWNETRADLPWYATIGMDNNCAQVVIYDAETKESRTETVSGSFHNFKNLIPNHAYSFVEFNSRNEVVNHGYFKRGGQVRMIDGGGNSFNIRDIGGWVCDGGTLKYGLIYRGSELDEGEVTSTHFGVTLSAAEKQYFRDVLGIRDEIDLRGTDGGNSTGALGNTVSYERFGLGYYQNVVNQSSERATVARIIKRVAANLKANKPMYIHCSAGADRTGTCIMFIEAICGVAQGDLDRDYEASSFAFEINKTNPARLLRKRVQGSGATWYGLVTGIAALEGNDFNDKVVRFLLREGVTIDEINLIRSKLIDGSPEILSNPYSDVTVTSSLTNVTIDKDSATAVRYQPFEAVITVMNMHKLTTVAVTMGGTDITSTCYNNGTIKIPSVTGNISIEAVAISPTTLGGYGINNAYTKSETETEILEATKELEPKSLYPTAFDSNGNVVAVYEYTPTTFQGNLVRLVLSTDNFDISDTATRLYVPKIVSRIPDNAFLNTNLTNIDIDNTATGITIGENAFPANAHICYLEDDKTGVGLLPRLTKSIKILTSRLIAPRTWAEIKQAVKLGLAPGLFPVGYEFEVERSDGDPLIFRVVDYNNIQAADPGLQHTMALELKYIYGQGNAAYTPIQFDAPEALYYAETALEPGTYHFNLNGLTAAGVNLSDGDYQFTLAQTLPQGGQITLDATAGTINTYAEIGGTTAIESNILLSQGTGGTDLGTTGNGNFNNVNRAVTGSNNYAQSAARQFLNSNEAAGSVWTPQTKFDRPPSWANTLNGFIKNLDPDFIVAVESANVICRTNTLFETTSLGGSTFGLGKTYVLTDKFFLPSYPEIHNAYDSASIKDGVVLDFYKNSTALEKTHYDQNNVQRAFLMRSPVATNAYRSRSTTSGGLMLAKDSSDSLPITIMCIIA